MTEAESRLRLLLSDFPYYASHALRIRDKRGRVVPFELNSAQRLLHEKVEAQLSLAGKIRALVLKGRQQGISTYIEGASTTRPAQLLKDREAAAVLERAKIK